MKRRAILRVLLARAAQVYIVSAGNRACRRPTAAAAMTNRSSLLNIYFYIILAGFRPRAHELLQLIVRDRAAAVRVPRVKQRIDLRLGHLEPENRQDCRGFGRDPLSVARANPVVAWSRSVPRSSCCASGGAAGPARSAFTGGKGSDADGRGSRRASFLAADDAR